MTGHTCFARAHRAEAAVIRIFFALILLGSAASAWFQAPLTWDGSYYLFKALDLGEPFTPLGRTINVVLQAPVLLAARFTDDLSVLRAIFVLPYVLVPVLALAISWWIVRREHAALFVWPALSIGVGILPNRFFYTSEGPMVTALFWPLLLAVLVGIRPWHLPIMLLLGAACWVAHPMTAVLLLLLAPVAAFLGWQRPEERKLLWAVAAVCVLAAAVKAAIPLSGYEAESLTVQRLLNSFRDTIVGWPLVSLSLVALAALLTLCQPWLGARGWLGLAVRYGPALLILASGLALIPWARNWFRWAHSLDFRFWIGPITAAFMAAATLEGAVLWRRLRIDRLFGTRVFTLQAVGVAFALVLFLQGRSWMHLTNTMEESLATLPVGCSDRARLENIAGTAMDHWGTVFYVINRQGREPERFVLDGDNCALLASTGIVRLAEWDERPASAGWFRLKP